MSLVAKKERMTTADAMLTCPRETPPWCHPRKTLSLRISTVDHVAATGLISSSFPRQAFQPLGTLPTADHTHESRPIPCSPSPPGRGRVLAQRRVATSVFALSTSTAQLFTPESLRNGYQSSSSKLRFLLLNLPPCDPYLSASESVPLACRSLKASHVHCPFSLQS
jgi:hypothetical protein